jgi:hypothetical protein
MDPLTERQNLAHFGDLVLADRDLHDQLRAAENVESFITLAVRLGAERGCHFSAATVQSAVEEKRRAWLERWL